LKKPNTTIMSFLLKDIKFRNKTISVSTLLWFLLSTIAAIIQLLKGKDNYNNYMIYKGVFWHTLTQVNLFTAYPTEYLDTNHYGSFFSILIAPFALLPDFAGCFLWVLCNALVLFYAIKKLPISSINQKWILLIAAIELMTSQHNVQFNPMLTSFVVLSLVFVQQKKEVWATFFIAAGFLTKLYGIVGLAFLFFSDNKITFVATFLFWLIVLAALPMLFSSPSFIVQSYTDWFHSIVEKNALNQESIMQGMNIMRLLNKIIHFYHIEDIYFYLSGAIVALMILIFNYKTIKDTSFQLGYLSFLLISIVIFSTSAESSTYIIAMTGVAIWYVIQASKTKWVQFILIFSIVLTSLSTTDLFPSFIKMNYIRPYALKALPCLAVWLMVSFQLISKKKNRLTVS